MKNNSAFDIFVLTLYSVLWTGLMAGVTMFIFWFAGIDPRNDLFGNVLANFGALLVPLIGWPAGLIKIWQG